MSADSVKQIADSEPEFPFDIGATGSGRVIVNIDELDCGAHYMKVSLAKRVHEALGKAIEIAEKYE